MAPYTRCTRAYNTHVQHANKAAPQPPRLVPFRSIGGLLISFPTSNVMQPVQPGKFTMITCSHNKAPTYQCVSSTPDRPQFYNPPKNNTSQTTRSMEHHSAIKLEICRCSTRWRNTAAFAAILAQCCVTRRCRTRLAVGKLADLCCLST